MALNMTLQFCHEDQFILVINKPSCIHSVMLPEELHSESSKESIAKLLLEHYPEQADVSSKTEDAGLVNRLDYETSGLLLAARTKEVWIQLRSDLLAESIHKSYMALLDGELKDEIVINSYIGTPNRRAKKVKVYEKEPKKKERALPAKTRFTPVQYSSERNCTLVRAVAHSAKRHQIRAHAAHIGHPLCGDTLYGGSSGSSDQFYLHAEKIKFLHPITNELLDMSAPTPEQLVSTCF